MAKSDPGDPGSMLDQIMTPQCEENRSGGKQPDSPPTHQYKTPKVSDSSGGDASIIGPGDVFKKG